MGERKREEGEREGDRGGRGRVEGSSWQVGKAERVRVGPKSQTPEDKVGRRIWRKMRDPEERR